MGLSRAEFEALSSEERHACRGRVRDAFLKKGARAVLDTLTDLPAAIDRLTGRP